MSISLSDLSPDQLAELVAQAQAQQEQEATEQRTAEAIDAALRDSLRARGVTLGDEWEDPKDNPARGYPKLWSVHHGDHFWISRKHRNLTEPSDENPDWDRNDPPEDGDPDGGHQ